MKSLNCKFFRNTISKASFSKIWFERRISKEKFRKKNFVSKFINRKKIIRNENFEEKKNRNKFFLSNIRKMQLHSKYNPTFQLSREWTSGSEPRTHFLLNRMVTPWNNMPKDISLAHSVKSFKSKLDLCTKTRTFTRKRLL